MTEGNTEVHQWETGWVCPVCKQARGPDGDDPCIKGLPGVKFACCGHGGRPQSLPYIYFENGVHVRFKPEYISYDDGRATVIFDNNAVDEAAEEDERREIVNDSIAP